MARRLAIDTAGDEHAAVLLDGDTLAAGAAWARQRGGGDPPLLARLSGLVREAGWQVTDLEQVAVGRGPGSFTGLRVGLSVAAGVAYGRDIPLYLINSLAILAACDPRAATAGALRGAGRNEAFAWLPGHEPVRLSGEALCAWIGRTAHIVDEPAGRLAQWCPPLAARAVPATGRRPLVEALRRSAIEIFEREKPVRYDELRPLYIQPAAAEERRNPNP